MDPAEILQRRLSNQQLGASVFRQPGELLNWMGALQAQDFPMSKWAIGIRLPGLNEEAVEGAYNRGEILRTHLMRPTWHLVSAENITWMLNLTSARIKTQVRSRQKELGLTADILSRSNRILEKNLAGGIQFTREELSPLLLEGGIRCDENRLSHLLFWAELEKVVCSGALRNKKPTYALFADRVKSENAFHRGEALTNLAGIYFQSHGPATLEDFIWWSGLTPAEARTGLEENKYRLVSEKTGDQTYWFREIHNRGEIHPRNTHLLPAYDEFIISYKDRSATLGPELSPKAISNNGIFRPVILFNGQVSGLWKRSLIKDKVVIETEFFRKHTSKETDEIRASALKFSCFLNKKVEVGMDGK